MNRHLMRFLRNRNKVLLKDIKHNDYIEYCQNKHNDINTAIDDYDHGIS